LLQHLSGRNQPPGYVNSRADFLVLICFLWWCWGMNSGP
jgi:hypothetical protein